MTNMSLWRQLSHGLRVLLRREAADRELAEEIEDYLDRSTESFVASGMSPAEARRAAQVEVGTVMSVRDEVRAAGWEEVVGAFFADLRYAARRLRSDPGFTVVAAMTLALGMGASTAIFSAVNPILFEPLPYPHAERIMAIRDGGLDGVHASIAFGTYFELATRSRTFEAMAVMRPWNPTMTSDAEPERFDGARVSAGYFRVLGMPPALGREFDATDDRPGGPFVAILSNALWRRRFGGDPTIVGRQIRLNDRPYLVIGVMPPRFENVPMPTAQIWTLLQYNAAALSSFDGVEWGHHLIAVGRLRDGVSLEAARRDLDAIAQAPIAPFVRPQWAAMKGGLDVRPLRDDITGAVRPALLAVLGAVLLLLAIACVNVTNLLLARGAQRRGEMAMRAALGAGHRRLIQQLLVESLLLAAIGGTLGLFVANAGVRALVALSPSGLPRVGAIAVDGAVFAFALGLTTIIGLLVGLVPALHASRVDMHAGLQRNSARTVGSHHFTRHLLVVAEVALALVLLVSAGLLLRSLQHLFAVEPGFTPAHRLTMQVQVSGRRFNNTQAVHAFFDQALDAVRHTPGVEAAAFTSQLPLSGDFDAYGVQFESSPNKDPNDDRSAFRYAVSPGYFEAAGIPLRRGRVFDARDGEHAPPVAIINESFAKREFPGSDAIGQRMHIGSSRDWFTIVGVVGDVKQTSLALRAVDAAYLPTVQWFYPDNPMSLVVRVQDAQQDVASIAPDIRRAIWAVDKDQPIVRVATMDELVAASASERHFALILFETFALVALALAAIGIYGVLSGSVTERMREIGVRCALGATRASILGLVVRQGLSLTTIGIVIGLTGAIVASRALITLLFGISRLDPITYAGVIALLLAVAALACWMPAWRAARVDPSITLRAE